MIRIVTDPQRWALLWLAGETQSAQGCTAASWRVLKALRLVESQPDHGRPLKLTDLGEIAAAQLAAGTAEPRSRGRWAVDVPSPEVATDDPIQAAADALTVAQVHALRGLIHGRPLRTVPTATRRAMAGKGLLDEHGAVTGHGRKVAATLPMARSAS